MAKVQSDKGTWYDPEELKESVENLKASFESYSVNVDNALERGLLKASLIVEAQAAVNAPKDTGRLWQSITHRVVRNGSNVEGQVGTNVIYAATHEFGDPSRNIPKQSYLGPALRQKRGQILQIITREIQGAKP